MTGIRVTMPFVFNGEKDNEVSIDSDNLRYSEVFNLAGLQIENEDNRDEALRLCKEISRLVKELHKLTL